MKKTFSIIFILALFCLSICAQQAKKSKGEPSKTEAELIRLEQEIGAANIRRDKAFFERVEADEFIFTASNGEVVTKKQDVASLDEPAGEIKLVSYDVDDVKVMIYGKVAVVTGRTTTLSRGANREITRRSRFTDVFIKRGGRWQIVAGHASSIPEAKK